MFAVIVKVMIKPEHKKAFVEEMLKDAVGSVGNEPGCLQFNVVQDKDDPNCLHLYEVYRDAATFEAHTKTPHFLRWFEATKDWLAKPLEISQGTHIFPNDDIWRKQA